MLALFSLLLHVFVLTPGIAHPFLPGITSSVAADTVRAGELYITNLPDSLDGIQSIQYTGLKLPTRSWLLNRTFFWETRETDRGDHALWFYVFRESDVDVPADSIAIHVHIR